MVGLFLRLPSPRGLRNNCHSWLSSALDQIRERMKVCKGLVGLGSSVERERFRVPQITWEVIFLHFLDSQYISLVPIRILRCLLIRILH